jgi:hypothetical protein
MAEVVWRLVEHRVAAFLVAGTAPDPQVAHPEATIGGLACWGAQARRPADALRHPRRQRMPERASLGMIGEQGNGHPIIMP